ncbi:hypothetical protein PROFUN_04814 [Planoprotostelium fungivorum]|uniref:Uncharacterized protein n=1 Tax=Planoprotostelium fungivorum TaxID=1890364 RepID=A0A2P6NT79_9EUKA|nr:hypothetical protein PROFUN_04814 [Planoprotostelium fungivorum]
MATSPWNKRALFFQKNKLAPPNARESAMPPPGAPVVLHLPGAEMVYENGTWRSDGAAEDQNMAYLEEDIQNLQIENNHLREQNNMLELKIELLLDMLAVNQNDIDTMKEAERRYQNKISKLERKR